MTLCRTLQRALVREANRRGTTVTALLLMILGVPGSRSDDAH